MGVFVWVSVRHADRMGYTVGGEGHLRYRALRFIAPSSILAYPVRRFACSSLVSSDWAGDEMRAMSQ